VNWWMVWAVGGGRVVRILWGEKMWFMSLGERVRVGFDGSRGWRLRFGAVARRCDLIAWREK